jgi:AcrR family transcriptional regulator
MNIDVVSENVGVSTDRRSRKRAARRDQLLDLADELVARHGVDGLTMTALAEAADYATASLYTYFPSRSALLAALQQRALRTLAEVAADHVARWDADLAERSAPTARVGALARLWGFSDLVLATAPRRHGRELQLQQQLLVAAGAETVDDAATVVPAAMAALAVPQQLIEDAVGIGALAPADAPTDPVHELVDSSLVRTIAWLLALNGALLADRLPTGLPSTGRALGSEITGALLRGWGANPADTEVARRIADRWLTDGGAS